MRPLSSGFRRFGLVALILVMLSYPAVAWDDRGMRPGVPRVQVLLIIDRQAGVSGTNVTEQKIRRLADAMKGGGLSGDPIVLDSNLSPDAILATVRAMVPGGQGALLIYYFGHGGTDPYRGHLLATSGGNLWSSALIEEARTRAPLVVLLTDACSTGFSAVTATTASAVTGSGAPAAPVGYETTRILSSLFLDHEGVVHINGSTWRSETATGEFGWNNEVDGALFTSALTRTLTESRFDQLDVNRDGIVSWPEVQGPVTALSRSLFDTYKEGFLSGRYQISAVDLERLRGQGTQTPQFFSYGSPAARGLAMYTPSPALDRFFNGAASPPPPSADPLEWKRQYLEASRGDVPLPAPQVSVYAGRAPTPADLPPRGPNGELPYVPPPPDGFFVAAAVAPMPPPGVAVAGPVPRQRPPSDRGWA